MDKNDIILSVCFVSFLLILLFGFLFFMLIWQRKRSNLFIVERERMQVIFNEQLLHSQLEAQEQTFNIISQEIHDNVGQILSLAKVQLNIIEQGEVLDRTLLSDVKESVSKAMADLRDIAKSLNSERIKQASLTETISHELARIHRSGLMLTNMQITGKEQTLQDQKKLILYRIIQEALQNILNHSKATNIDLQFDYKPDFLHIQIADNGKGFDSNLPNRNDGLGLQNMVNRAALIGGSAHINSIINSGTTITIITPYA
jgi:two-component system NarL family sensor kinase